MEGLDKLDKLDKLDADEGLLTESHRIAGYWIIDVSNFQNVYKLNGSNVLTELKKTFEHIELLKPFKHLNWMPTKVF